MTSITSLQNQLRYSKRQTAFAWAKYYEEANYNQERNIVLYRQHKNIIDGAEEMPKHIVEEIEKMTAELRKQIECPICLEIIEVGHLKMTGCGHKYCEECYNKIDECAICRKKIYKKK